MVLLFAVVEDSWVEVVVHLLRNTVHLVRASVFINNSIKYKFILKAEQHARQVQVGGRKHSVTNGRFKLRPKSYADGSLAKPL